MSNDFNGSIAQENVIFSTEVSVTTSPGDNYYKLLIYVKLSDIGTYLTATPSEGDLISLKSSSYAAATKGLLKKMLDAFYTEQSYADVYIAIYGTTHTLAKMFEAYKSYAYFTAMCSVTADEIVALAALQKTNSDLVGPILLNLESYSVATPTDVLPMLIAGKYDAWVGYATDADDSQPTFYQLGRTLSYINESGTPVGNSMDFVFCMNIAAAGAEGENLDATAKTTLADLNINYFNTVGNGTGAVDFIGGKSLNGLVLAAEWLVAYCNFVGRVKTAEIISQMNTFRSDRTYTKIKQVVANTVGLFTDTTGMGRLTNFVITAPPFAKLPNQGGDKIIIPNAWKAEYVDNVRHVTVQGTLYINA